MWNWKKNKKDEVSAQVVDFNAESLEGTNTQDTDDEDDELDKATTETTLQGINAGISHRLHDTYPFSKWRWICRPKDFATNGGIARIEVVDIKGEIFLVDVCLDMNSSESVFMALYWSGAVELADKIEVAHGASGYQSLASDNRSITSENDVDKWFNIVFIEALNNLIDNLVEQEEYGLHINQSGRVYIDGCDNEIYNFDTMPDLPSWRHVINRLVEEGLFADVREDDGTHLFISWA